MWRAAMVFAFCAGMVGVPAPALAQAVFGPPQALAAGDGAFGDGFGHSVAIDGDTAIVGSSNDDIGSNFNQGSAYVFIRTGTTWSQQAKLTAPDGQSEDHFGGSVAIGGDRLVVGAADATVGPDLGRGAAYVFTRSGGVWSLEAKLLAGDGGVLHGFGRSVAIEGDTVVVGAPRQAVNQGAAYVFVRSLAGWVQQAKLLASDGVSQHRFGESVGVSADTAAIGANGVDQSRGAVYLFTRTGTVWSQQQRLVASDRQPGDDLGRSVAIDQDTVAAGASDDATGGTDHHGSAYVFVRQGPLWTEQQKLTASDAASFDGFGASIALRGDIVMVGVQAESGTPTNRATYIFERSATQWTQQQKLTSPSGTSDGFGRSVALTPGSLIVGASGSGAGAAYVYADSNPNTAPTIVPDGPLTREQGVAATSSVVATVSDVEDPAGGLVVSGTPPAGISLSGLANTDGTVAGLVGAECAAPVGTAAVPLSVTDSGGLTASDTLLVDVMANSTPPLISCGPDIAVTAAPAECSATVDYTPPVASDDCPGASVACSPAPGAAFPAGATAVTCTAIDAAGNTAGCPFTVTVTPNLTISPQSQGFAAGGGAGTASVSAAAGCAWTAVSNDAWITITSGANSEGNGVVGYSVAAHTGGGARTGTLTIAGQTFTVTQQAGCPFALAPTAADFPIGGGDGSLSVTTSAACTWTAASNDAWITVTSSAAGTGNGTVSYSVGSGGGVPRAGTITVAGLRFTVTQSCAFQFSQTSFSVPAQGFSQALVNVLSNMPECPWTAVSDVPWIQLHPGWPGRGDASVQYDVQPTTSAAPRTGTLTVAGLTFTVNQEGCERHLQETSFHVPAQGFQRANVNVSANVQQCSWTAVSNAPWISIRPGWPGSGTGFVEYDVQLNASPTARTGTLTVADLTFTVSQDGCERHLQETSFSVPAQGFQRASVNVAANLQQCPWTAVSNVPWISIRPGWPGSGTGHVEYDVQPTDSLTLRTGTLTVADLTFTVYQEGTCAFSLSRTSDAFGPAGGDGRVNVTAQSECPWTAVSNSDWITITSGASGSGRGRVEYSVAAHAGAAARTGTMTVAGRTFIVTQSACEFSLAPPSERFPPAGGTDRVRVRTSRTCGWTAVSNDAWIRITSAAGGTGDGVIDYFVAPHAGTVARTGTMMIGGQPFTVTQSACEVSLNPQFEEFLPAGGTGRVRVSTFGGCGWRAVSNDPWIQVTINSIGSGNDRVEFVVAPHTGPLARTGTLTIGGQTFTVIQHGSCSFALTPAVQDFTPAGGNGSLAVTASSGCPWTAVSSEAWITITSGGGGTGNGVVSYSVGASNGLPRSGTVTVGGRAAATITQGCAFTLAANIANVDSSQQNVGVDLQANNQACAWSAVSNTPWITLSSVGSGRGSQRIRLEIAANPSGTARTGTVTVAGQTFTVIQAGCTLMLSPPFVNLGPDLAQETIHVLADNRVCPWLGESNVPWITFPFGSSGTGSGQILYVVGPNTSPFFRVGHIVVGGQGILVTQDGRCTFALGGYFHHVAAAGGGGTVVVTTGGTCSWTAVSNDPWIRVTPPTGTGPAFVQFTVAPHTGRAQRNGTMTIAGQTFEVIQAGTGN